MSNSSSKDFSLFSGERQTAINLSEIRLDHLLRYELAKDFIQCHPNSIHSCLDLFCGNGYGTFLLSKAYPNLKFYGIDGSEDAIKCAKDYYSLSNNLYESEVFPFSSLKIYDLVICFESLEHVEDESSFISLICNSLNKGGYLLLSVPNENLHSLSLNPHPFHFRHYTYDDIVAKFNPKFEILNWYGQNTYKFTSNGRNTHHLLKDSEMNLIEEQEGQVNVYVLKKKDA